MLRVPFQRNRRARSQWLNRVDRMAGDLNVVLVVFAIGLAALDLTCLVAERLIDRLPQATPAVFVEQLARSPYTTALP